MIKIEVVHQNDTVTEIFGWVEYLTILDEGGAVIIEAAADLMDYLDMFDAWDHLPKGATIRRNDGRLVPDFGSPDFPSQVTVMKLYERIERDIGSKEPALFGGLAFHVRGPYSRKIGRPIAARRAVEDLKEKPMELFETRVEDGGTLVYAFRPVDIDSKRE